jgi:hypothetical protein
VRPTQIAKNLGIARISKPPVNPLSGDVCDKLLESFDLLDRAVRRLQLLCAHLPRARHGVARLSRGNQTVLDLAADFPGCVEHLPSRIAAAVEFSNRHPRRASRDDLLGIDSRSVPHLPIIRKVLGYPKIRSGFIRPFQF